MTTTALPSPAAWRGYAHLAGPAASQGSKRIVRAGGTGRPLLVDDDRRLRDWRGALVMVMRESAPDLPRSGAVRVWIVVSVCRPRSHFGTGRNADRLKAGAPQWPANGKDVDKVARATLDAGSLAGWWRDDRQVCDLHVQRFYDSAESVEVRAWEMEPVR